MKKTILLLTFVAILVNPAASTVMGQNTDELPPGCDSISGMENITIEAGTEQAEQFPSKMYAYSDRQLEFEPCTKLEVTFINNDSIRHQWMVHGLPEKTYDMRMFTLEVTGPGQETGTFILPSGDESLMIHCSVSQHMQKGMKAQITVGDGDGDISNVPGHTGEINGYEYPQKSAVPMGAVAGILMAFFGAGLIVLLKRKTD